MQIISGKDIAEADADIIVNAANGCGYMGGKWAQKELRRGVAEHLNYYTKGALEKEAMKRARKYSRISSWLCGRQAGEVFPTGSHGLNCDTVLHAVTMRYPSGKSSLASVEKAIKTVFQIADEMNYHTIAMPPLGCGNGRLDKEDVLSIIHKECVLHPKITVFIYVM